MYATADVKLGATTADDIGNTPSTARVINVGETSLGELETSNDRDVFKLALTGGVVYTIRCDLGLAAGQLPGAFVRVEGGGMTALSKTLLAADPSRQQPAQTTYTFSAPATASYSITLGSDSSRPATGSYGVTVAPAADDYGSSAALAGALPVGGTLNGTLNNAADSDRFAVTLTAGSSYWFELAHAPASAMHAYTTQTAQVSLIDSRGKSVAEVSGYVYQDKPLTLPFTAPQSATYYVQVADTASGTGNYAISALQASANDAGATQAGAAVIAVGTPLSATLESNGDVDMVKLAVQEGTSYLLTLVHDDAAIRPRAIYLEMPSQGSLLDSRAFEMSGYDDYRVVTAKANGDAYFIVKGPNTAHGGAYTLQALAITPDDHANTMSNAHTLAIGAAIGGGIDYIGDADWIKVTLQANTQYLFELLGAPAGAGTLSQMSTEGIVLYDALGAALPIKDLAGAGKAFTYTASTAGDYYLAIRGYNANTGTYVLKSAMVSGDTVAPVMVGFSPDAMPGGLRPYDNILLTFNEHVKAGKGTGIVLKDSTGHTVQSWSDMSGGVAIRGTTVTVNPTYMLDPGQQYTLELSAGSLTDLAGNSYGGGIYRFGTVALSAGTAGDDYLTGAASGARLDGGAGLDTVVYGERRNAYTIKASGDAIKVEKASSVGADTLSGVERILFKDGAVGLDIAGAGGQAYRLYQAAFNRVPDEGGLGYWIAQMDNGMSVRDVAYNFFNSNEFQIKNWMLDDVKFVTQLYWNVLHRLPEQPGVDYWVGALGQGLPRHEVLAFFSEGPENQAAVLKVVGNGFAYTPYVG